MLEAYLVLKPGAHGLVWALPRTAHWTATALEDAGFEVREKIFHLFGQGFPKSADIGKAIDKLLGVDREVIGNHPNPAKPAIGTFNASFGDSLVTAPATELAKKWDGFGTHLKPAVEEWILVRKPLEGTVADNVIDHGCGGLNIDGCRVGKNPGYKYPNGAGGNTFSVNKGIDGTRTTPVFSTGGRFPANLVLSHHPDCKKKKCVDDCAVKMLDDQKNGASRFFYCAKPSKKERGIFNNHPTVKPIKLIRYLSRLITPPGGKIIDPFAGSGAIGCAAVLEGFEYIGIEIEEDSYELASERLAKYIKKAESRYTKKIRKVVR
jgi:site-specific DNA-methyltransferase (adenine-specific)